MNKKNQIRRRRQGYTAFELLIVLGMLGSLAFSGLVLYVIAHFVMMYW